MPNRNPWRSGSGLRSWLRPRFYELAVLVNFALVVYVIRYRSGINFRYVRTLTALAPFAARVWGLSILIGFLARVLWVAARDGRSRALRYVRAWCRPRRLADLVRLMLVFIVAAWAYLWLKAFIPVVNPALHDAALDRLDALVHFGIDPNRFLIALFPQPAWWRFLDFCYALFLPALLVGFGWLASTLSISERARFAAGFGLLWILGSWLYVLFPARGPCYAFPDDYASVRPSVPGSVKLQNDLAQQYEAIRARRIPPSGAINPGYGTAAMPSLHVAVLAFLAFWMRRRSRPLSALFFVLTFFTFVASLVTGWHYAVDGYAGFLLAALLAFFLGRGSSGMNDRPSEGKVSRPPVP